MRTADTSGTTQVKSLRNLISHFLQVGIVVLGMCYTYVLQHNVRKDSMMYDGMSDVGCRMSWDQPSVSEIFTPLICVFHP